MDLSLVGVHANIGVCLEEVKKMVMLIMGLIEGFSQEKLC
jgi:hypothetical protein